MMVAQVETGSYRNAAEVLALVRDFKFCTLPRAQWTHRAHLTVALWHSLRYPWAEAVELMRRGIKRYNEANGILTTESSGYHETITLFWMRFIREYLINLSLPDCTLASLANELVERCPASLPFEYYSRELLMSAEARRAWVEPDLKPLA
ncbi:MAG TPA: hypothetical protein VGB17_13455 [Pyrinomonadaceae bacterium]|jgi:hypothetical protein